MMNLPSEKNVRLLLEQHLERRSLLACRSATLVQCIKDYGLEPFLDVTPPSEEKHLFVRVNDIAAAKKHPFQQVTLDQCLYPLSTELERMVALYKHFLLNEYTPRYRLLISPPQLQWLERVIALIVVRYIMEQKYEHSTHEGGIPFADEWVASEMARIMLLRELPGMVAPLVHHIVRDPEQTQGMIEQFHIGLDIRMKVCLVCSPQQLPPLPQGISLPLALPAYKKKEEKPQDE